YVAAGRQLDVPTCGRKPVLEAQIALRRHRHVHEEVDVVPELPLPDTDRGAVSEKVLAAGVLVAGVFAIPDHVALLGAGAADGVMAPAGVIGDDRELIVSAGQQP